MTEREIIDTNLGELSMASTQGFYFYKNKFNRFYEIEFSIK